ncbi:MAG: rhomboid family intramembrane serine protease, partial [Marinirhabdus sp.]
LYFYRNIGLRVFFYGALLTGLGTWAIGRPSLHIGASGIVYLLAAFLFFKGAFSKHFQLIALALTVAFLYGGLLWYVLPVDPKISWEGHLSGFVVGFVFALIFRNDPIETEQYEWEHPDYNPADDPFLKHFDEDGNFIEVLPEDAPAEETGTVETPSGLKPAPKFSVKYFFSSSGTEKKSSSDRSKGAVK